MTDTELAGTAVKQKYHEGPNGTINVFSAEAVATQWNIIHSMSEDYGNKMHFLLSVNPLTLFVEIHSTPVMSLFALVLSSIIESSRGG